MTFFGCWLAAFHGVFSSIPALFPQSKPAFAYRYTYQKTNRMQK